MNKLLTALVADPDLPRHPDRSVVDVAVGILIRDGGDFLMTSRPKGKAYAGYWEFPGGKFEPRETVTEALTRELNEELGIETGQIEVWKSELVDYPHALVRLQYCMVLDWTGKLQMRENQLFAWQCLPLSVAPILPGAVPVLQGLAIERGFVGATY